VPNKTAPTGVFNYNYLGQLGVSIVKTLASPIMFLALGRSMVLKIGLIDLSSAAIAPWGALLLALALQPMCASSFVFIPVFVTVIGAINGAVISYAQVPPLSLTIGTPAILQTAALVFSGAGTIYLINNCECISIFFEKQIFSAEYIP
jgi:ribose transport system permease protein